VLVTETAGATGRGPRGPAGSNAYSGRIAWAVVVLSSVPDESDARRECGGALRRLVRPGQQRGRLLERPSEICRSTSSRSFSTSTSTGGTPSGAPPRAALQMPAQGGAGFESSTSRRSTRSIPRRSGFATTHPPRTRALGLTTVPASSSARAKSARNAVAPGPSSPKARSSTSTLSRPKGSTGRRAAVGRPQPAGFRCAAVPPRRDRPPSCSPPPTKVVVPTRPIVVDECGLPARS